MDHKTINQLMKLEFLAGQFETMDAFTMLYERMLNECQLTNDKTTARKLQGVLLQQAQYFLNQWLKEKPTAPNPMLLMEFGKTN